MVLKRPDKGFDIKVHQLQVLLILSGIGQQRYETLSGSSLHSRPQQVNLRLMLTH